MAGRVRFFIYKKLLLKSYVNITGQNIMQLEIYVLLPIFVVLCGATFYLGWVINAKAARSKLMSVEDQAKRIIADAEKSATNTKKEKLLEVKDEWYRKKQEFDSDYQAKKSKLKLFEKQVQDKGSFTGKITAKVTEVCLEKGCWMKVEKGNGETIMVRFKDYGFFMPKNIVGQTVVLEGEAKEKEVSVKQQQHLAEDAGKTKAEISKIKEVKKETQFIAKGVLVI